MHFFVLKIPDKHQRLLLDLIGNLSNSWLTNNLQYIFSQRWIISITNITLSWGNQSKIQRHNTNDKLLEKLDKNLLTNKVNIYELTLLKLVTHFKNCQNYPQGWSMNWLDVFYCCWKSTLTRLHSLLPTSQKAGFWDWHCCRFSLTGFSLLLLLLSMNNVKLQAKLVFRQYLKSNLDEKFELTNEI